jgi:two-component system chemotaxis response regulator CheY
MSDEKPAAPFEDPNKETILIAEDSPPNRKILAHLLEKLGYKVTACEDGQQAWDKLHAGECGNVVAVISDIMMPNMDGIQFLKNVRGEEKYKNLPFVLVTAVSDKEYIMQAKELNVNGYILKPVTFQRVTDKLHELFPNKTLPKLAG